MAVLSRTVGEDGVVTCRERESCGSEPGHFAQSQGGPLGKREGVCSQPTSSQPPKQAPAPTVKWALSFPLPGDETWRKPSILAKTRTPANCTSTLPTASQGAGAEGLSHGLLPPMYALRQTAPCLQLAACPGVSQLNQIITAAAWGPSTGHSEGCASRGRAGVGEPAFMPDTLPRPWRFRG